MKMSDHYPEPVLFHCQSSEVEPELGMNTLRHHWHEQPVFVGTHAHSFSTIQNDSDFPRVPCVSYGQFISYRAWIQLDKMVKLYIPLGLREVKIGNIIKHMFGGWFSFFFWC